MLRRRHRLERRLGRRSSSRNRDSLLHRTHLIPTKIRFVVRRYLAHGGVGLAVVVLSIPEQETYPALVFGDFDLGQDVLRGVGVRAPAEGLQPGAQNYATVFGDQEIGRAHV